jgi:hypothetical protein
LIPKKNKDPRLLKNWRPISLLNTDYKIITKVLANRIKKVLPTVINHDQVAYLKNRFIGQNIRTIFDTMGYTKLMDQKGIIAFLDFEKAFDTVNWEVIYDALKLFNVGPEFVRWVQTIYNEPQACVTNNGYSSPFFITGRGVRQGCPLSAYLFIMVVELLAHKIRKDESIKGIKIGNTEIKLVQMADDTTTFIEDQNSLENILKLLKTFEQYAGLRLNKTKTEAMWIGRSCNNKSEPLGIKWVKEVHALGICFSYDTDSVVLKNFMDRAKAFKRILDMWSQRDLSLLGKITILKSLAFSKVIYQCGVLAIPPDYIELLNDIAYRFIWNNKPNKIKRNTLIADYESGGLKMLDIQCFVKAQKAMWVKRLVTNDQASWKAFPNLFLYGLLENNTFKCNMECLTRPKDFPDFYWEVLKYWFEIKSLVTMQDNVPDIRRECLWLNKNIKVNKKEVRWYSWQKKGINIIHDLLTKQGTFLTAQEIENKYNVKCNILKYNALKDAIPLDWRKKLKTMQVSAEAISFEEHLNLKINNIPKSIKTITNKDLYWTLIKKKQEKAIIIDSIGKTLNIDENTWKIIFKIPHILKDTKIRTFQYKLLFNLIPCNLYLFRIKKSDTDKCNTCQSLDDIAHYFYKCQTLQRFWNNFSRWWKNVTNNSINLDTKTIIVGITNMHTKNQLLNACILLAKWHIYKTKLNQSQIFFYKFLCDLKYYLIIEKSIALRNNNILAYQSLWYELEEHLT